MALGHLPPAYKATSDQVYARTRDVDWRHTSGDLDALYRQGSSAAAELKGLVRRVGAATGGVEKAPPSTPENPYGLKGRPRAEERVKDFAGDASQLTDIVRSSLAFNTVGELYAGLAKLNQEANIVFIKDRFAHPYASGYRDVLLKVRMSNGHVAELQLHLNSVLGVKDGPGHSLYEKQRDIWAVAERENRSLSDAERTLVDKYNTDMRRLYDAAYYSALNGSP